MAKYQSILFDLDGTLVDTAPDFVYALNKQRNIHGMAPIDEAMIRNTVSDGARALTKLAFGGEPGEAIFDARRQELLDLYEDCVGNWAVLFEGMIGLIEAIESKSIPWGVVTNKPRLYTDLLFDRMTLSSQPAVTVCPDEVSQSKPNPESLFLACKHLGCDAANSLYVGDHERDIVAGKAAQMETAAVSYGYIMDQSDIETWQADHIIHHPEEMIALL